MKIQLHHKRETVSTNLDARSGMPGDVFTADYQTAGRGRLDHKWLSPPGANLLMSMVLGVGEMPIESIATLPLVIGLAVLRTVEKLLGTDPGQPGTDPTGNEGQSPRIRLKWPNDVLINGRKVAGILCERHGDNVIAGIGINVKRQDFPPEIAIRAISLGDCPQLCGDCPQIEQGTVPSTEGTVPRVRDAVVESIGGYFDILQSKGFAELYDEIRKVDALRGQTLQVRQTDDDAEPVCGLCGGIMPDGSLDVGGVRVYAGEAHVEKMNTRRI